MVQVVRGMVLRRLELHHVMRRPLRRPILRHLLCRILEGEVVCNLRQLGEFLLFHSMLGGYVFADVLLTFVLGVVSVRLHGWPRWLGHL